MKVVIQKDGDGFTALVEGVDNIFAHGKTEEEAKQELLNVLEMMMDVHKEELAQEESVKVKILNNEVSYAL